MTSSLVVTGKTVDSGFDQNKTEFGITILAVAFHVLSDGNSLLDEVVQIFGDFRAKTVSLQDTEDLVTGDVLNLRDTVGVSQKDTDLRRGHTLFGELADEFRNFGRGDFAP